MWLKIVINFRLKESVGATDFLQWNINIYNQCQKLLKDPIQAGKTILQKLETKINCKFFADMHEKCYGRNRHGGKYKGFR